MGILSPVIVSQPQHNGTEAACCATCDCFPPHNTDIISSSPPLPPLYTLLTNNNEYLRPGEVPAQCRVVWECEIDISNIANTRQTVGLCFLVPLPLLARRSQTNIVMPGVSRGERRGGREEGGRLILPIVFPVCKVSPSFPSVLWCPPLCSAGPQSVSIVIRR